MTAPDAKLGGVENGMEAVAPDMRDPRSVLAVLEADQIVAAKQHTHFGRRGLSNGTNALLWGLRVYVVVMLVLVVISAIRVIHSMP